MKITQTISATRKNTIIANDKKVTPTGNSGDKSKFSHPNAVGFATFYVVHLPNMIDITAINECGKRKKNEMVFDRARLHFGRLYLKRK